MRRSWCQLSLVETFILNLPVSCHLQRGLLCKNCFTPAPPQPPTKSSQLQVHTIYLDNIHSISSVQSLSRVQLFATPWTAACQASLFITNSRSSLKLMSIESVMPSNHLDLCCPILLSAFNLSQHQGLFQ